MVDMFINGRKVVKLTEAAQLIGYTPRGLEYHIAQGALPCLKHRHTRYVSMSALIVFQKRMREQQTKWQQIAAWWQQHPGIQSQIGIWSDLQRRLRRAGIQVSDTLVRLFLTKYRPYVSLQQRVLAWLEADPARRAKNIAAIRRDILGELHQDLSEHTIRRALEKYDAQHGQPQPPFDLSQYLTVEQAAERLAILPGSVNMAIRHVRLVSRLWQGRRYVLSASVDEYLTRRQARLECREANQAEAQRRQMLRSCPWNRGECQLRRLQGRSYFCPTCGHYWSGVYD